MKIDEYEPVMQADQQRQRELPQRDRAEDAGTEHQQRQHRQHAARLVLIDRISTWFIDTLITSAYGVPSRQSVRRSP